jgi:hypothetical protein
VSNSGNPANSLAEGLFGATFASTMSWTDQEAKIEDINGYRTAALGTAAGANDAGEVALLKLKAMSRAAEIPGLDASAKALVGVTVLITGLFTGIGFSTGDFVRMIRDHWGQGFLFLILASVALLVGTFAVAINAYRSQFNLWTERIALYAGVVCAAAAFGLGAWGLSQGASSATTPTISAAFSTTAPATLSVTASSSDVPRKEHMILHAWGFDQTQKKWDSIDDYDLPPASDGTINSTLSLSPVDSYTTIEIDAQVTGAKDTTVTSPPVPCPVDTSCLTMQGLAAPAATPSATASATPSASASASH